MKKERLYTLLAFALLLLLCSYPLFVNLGKLSLRMWDESRNAINALEMLKDHNFIVTHFDGQPDNWNSKPPFLIWCIALFMKVLGTTTLAVRLPSAIVTLGAVAFLFWMSKKHLKTQLPGFIAGLVLCTSVGFIDYHVARNGDFDAMLSVWMLFYSFFFFIYLETGDRKQLQYSALFILLAILTKGVAGCMILPGLLLFVLLHKPYWWVFKKWEFYAIPLSGFLFGLSYYFIREGMSVGYIKSVLENEITGRYMATNEGHTGDALYYIRLMADTHYSLWIWAVPLAFVASLFSRNERAKRLSIFLFIISFTYLFVISFAKTKLPWYDAPLYPLMALQIGLGAYTVYTIALTYTPFNNFAERTIAFAFFCLLLFYFPGKKIFATSIRAKKETYYPELFYGDFLNAYHKKFPSAKTLSVISDGYNPHLIFYSKALALKGIKILITGRGSALKINDTIMICEPEKTWPTDKLVRFADTLYQEDGNKFVLHINNPEGPHPYLSPSLKLFFGQVDFIKTNLVWLKDLENKAAKNKNDLEKQIKLDAIYKIQKDSLLSKPAIDSIRRKFKLEGC